MTKFWTRPKLTAFAVDELDRDISIFDRIENKFR